MATDGLVRHNELVQDDKMGDVSSAVAHGSSFLLIEMLLSQGAALQPGWLCMAVIFRLAYHMLLQQCAEQVSSENGSRASTCSIPVRSSVGAFSLASMWCATEVHA